MTTQKFHSSTQYNDMLGSVAADRADAVSMERWLEKHGLIQDGEHIIGISVNIDQLSASGTPYTQVIFLIATNEINLRVLIPGLDEPPTILVRRIVRDISLSEFISFFKRLEITLSNNGEFEGRNYTYIN